MVVNGACKDNDFAVIGAELAGQVELIERLEDRALIALQGPEGRRGPGRARARSRPSMVFMDAPR